jgi:hypothetical protein
MTEDMMAELRAHLQMGGELVAARQLIAMLGIGSGDMQLTYLCQSMISPLYAQPISTESSMFGANQLTLRNAQFAPPAVLGSSSGITKLKYAPTREVEKALPPMNTGTVNSVSNWIITSFTEGHNHEIVTYLLDNCSDIVRTLATALRERFRKVKFTDLRWSSLQNLDRPEYKQRLALLRREFADMDASATLRATRVEDARGRTVQLVRRLLEEMHAAITNTTVEDLRRDTMKLVNNFKPVNKDDSAILGEAGATVEAVRNVVGPETFDQMAPRYLADFYQNLAEYLTRSSVERIIDLGERYVGFCQRNGRFSPAHIDQLQGVKVNGMYIRYVERLSDLAKLVDLGHFHELWLAIMSYNSVQITGSELVSVATTAEKNVINAMGQEVPDSSVAIFLTQSQQGGLSLRQFQQ